LTLILEASATHELVGDLETQHARAAMLRSFRWRGSAQTASYRTALHDAYHLAAELVVDDRLLWGASFARSALLHWICAASRSMAGSAATCEVSAPLAIGHARSFCSCATVGASSLRSATKVSFPFSAQNLRACPL